jgi:hypothetical protein
MKSGRTISVLLAAAVLCVSAAASADILVYDNNAINGYAQAAANNLSATVTVATTSDFNTLLNSQAWEVVLVDCPSTPPAGGWTDLINYVNAGNEVVMSFWDWDNDAGQGDPGLATAFGYTTATSFSLSDGVSTLVESATGAGAAVFAGVPGMPHNSWFDNWSDDGDAYTFGGASQAIAELQGNPDPVTIVNGNFNAIATFAVDEWMGAGAVEFWEGMANFVIGGVPVELQSIGVE